MAGFKITTFQITNPFGIYMDIAKAQTLAQIIILAGSEGINLIPALYTLKPFMPIMVLPGSFYS